MFHGREIKRVVVKVGTSTLTHQSGHLNMQRIDHLCRVLSDIKNSGIDVVLVTSGAITAGVNKLKLKKRPDDIKGKQAAASVGQSELMFLYDKFFSQYGYTVAQLLLTKSVTEDPQLRENVTNTLETLLNLGAIPVINENDAVAVEEIVYGDNDMLSAVTSSLINADLLIILSDIDGLYEENPNENPDARLIPVVDEITAEIEAIKSVDPYQYKFLLEDDEAVESKKEDLRAELREYEDYGKQLDEVLEGFVSKGAVFTWRMN